MKIKYGSALVFSLIILSLLLAITLGMISISVRETRMSQNTGRSTQSFQSADSAAEIVLNKLKTAIPSQTLQQALGCSDGKVSGTIIEGSGSYAVTFIDKDENTLDCSALVSEVTEIKSVGDYKETTRAVKKSIK